jgi:hypothetical protein
MADTCNGTCLYHLFFSLRRTESGRLANVCWCRHPNHVQEIAGAGCRGRDFVAFYEKKLPSQADYPWPQPVDIQEGRYVGRRGIAGALGPYCLLAADGPGA